MAIARMAEESSSFKHQSANKLLYLRPFRIHSCVKRSRFQAHVLMPLSDRHKYCDLPHSLSPPTKRLKPTKASNKGVGQSYKPKLELLWTDVIV
eukprot:1283078-Amphidinium_carterae.1